MAWLSFLEWFSHLPRDFHLKREKTVSELFLDFDKDFKSKTGLGTF
jgi:hypothetical protein